MADLTGMEWAFTCPPEVTDPDIAAGYERLRLKLDMELTQMPTSISVLRGERILRLYVLIKQREGNDYGTGEGFTDAEAERKANEMLNKMIHDWDDVLIKSKPTGQEAALRVEKKFKQIFVDVLGAVDMPGYVRNELADRFTRTVVAAGLDHG